MIQKIRNINWKIILLAASFLIIGIFIGQKKSDLEFREKILENKRKEFVEKQNEIKEATKELQKEQNLKSLFSNLEAKAIVIKKIGGEEIFSKNKNKILPIASLTKIINAATILESKEEKIYISSRALQSQGYYGLMAGEIFSKNEAVKYMLIGSINDLASAISFGRDNISYHWKDFMKSMNGIARRENMNSTLFFSENGLDINNHILGSYSTASDMAKITEYFYKKYPKIAQSTELTEATFCSNLTCHKVKNTNILLEKYPEIVFTKTGFTKKSGGSLATIINIDGEKYTVIILGSSKEGRFQVLASIINKLKKLNNQIY